MKQAAETALSALRREYDQLKQQVSSSSREPSHTATAARAEDGLAGQQRGGTELREKIANVDVSDKASWKFIVEELFAGGFSEAELEVELAASPLTLHKWRTGQSAPREMTRRLMRRAILELIDERGGTEQ